MSILVRTPTLISEGDTETEVVVSSGYDEKDDGTPSYNNLVMHHWSRHYYSHEPHNQVYVLAGYFKDAEAREPDYSDDDTEDYYGNIIVEEEDFIEAVLALFPTKLKRVDA